MTDSERLPDAESARPEDPTPASTETGTRSAADSTRTSAEQEHRDARSATFRSDGGPGSVLRERQPGFGGMDAREAAEGEPHWQAVTSDRYGHRIEPVPEADGTSSGDEAESSSGEPPAR